MICINNFFVRDNETTRLLQNQEIKKINETLTLCINIFFSSRKSTENRMQKAQYRFDLKLLYWKKTRDWTHQGKFPLLEISSPKAKVPRRKTIRTDPLDFDFWTIRGCRISLPRDSRDGFFPASVIESAEGACARARTLAPRADPWFYTSLKSRRLCITRNPLVYSARYAAASCILTRVIYVRGP